jgi:hypothetical protein
MLDTARHTYWNAIRDSTPSADNETEIEFLRKATAWNTHTNLSTLDNATPEIRTITIPQTPKGPPRDQEHFPKRRQVSHQDPTKEQPPTNPPPGRHEHTQHTQSPSAQNRTDKSYALLANFKHAPRPTTISEHLYTANDVEELARINAELRGWRPGSKAHKSILQHRDKLTQTTEIDALLTTKAQQFNLVPIKVIGDGNCLQDAVNTAHKEQTNHYLANNDDLRLLEHTRDNKQTNQKTL